MDDLRKRFLNISKQVLTYVKMKGFEKKGSRCILNKNELVFKFSAGASKPWANSDTLYGFYIAFEVEINNSEIIDMRMHIENYKKTTAFSPLQMAIVPKKNKDGAAYLKPDDPEDHDQSFVEGVIEVIEEDFLPLVNSLSSADDVMRLLEKEYALDKKDRFFYKHCNIYMDLEIFYACKGWKQKTLDVLEKEMQAIPVTAVYLVEARKNKYIKYFENKGI